VALFNPSLLLDFLPLTYTTPAYNYTDFAPPPVTLTGSYQDHGVDANGNGLYEALNINIGLTPGEAGLFIASGRLLDSAGREIGWATSQKELAGSGGQTVTLSFSGGQIWAGGGDGPFTLADLLVYHSGVPDQDAFLSTAHTTAGYSHLKFEGSAGGGGGGGSQRIYLPFIIK